MDVYRGSRATAQPSLFQVGAYVTRMAQTGPWKLLTCTVLVGKFSEFSPHLIPDTFHLLSSTTYNNMTNEDILKPISANRRRYKHLSNEHKSAIVTSRAAGLPWHEVASRNLVPISIAHSVFQAYTNTNSVNEAPRSGRPKVFTHL